MIEEELRKHGTYIWRKDDAKHRSTLRITQITKHMVRSVEVNNDGFPKGRSFWNPKCIFLYECTPAETRESHAE